MRVSTQLFFRQFNSSLEIQQSNIAKLQQQIASGRRLLTPSDDPAGASRALDMTQAISRLDQFNNNAVFAEQRLGLEEATLDSHTNLLQRVKELAIAAGNLGAQSADTFTAIRSELEQRLQEVLNIANTRDGNGEYLFAGFQGDVQPFVLNGGAVSYNGDQGQQMLQVGANKLVATSDSGYEVFQAIRNGNGTFSVNLNSANSGNGVIAAGSIVDSTVYQLHDFTIQFTSATTYDVINNTTAATIITGATYTDGQPITFNGIQTSISGAPQTGDEFFVQTSRSQDIFTTLQNFIAAVSVYPADTAGQARSQQAIQSVIADLDQSLGKVLEIRTSVGARLNSIDSTSDENEAVKIEFQRALSDIQDLDYAEAISALELQLSTLEATQQSFIALQRQSLFDFIR